MNKTKIEWCTMTWNPVTGCLHGCPYCYARKQSRRFKGYDREISDRDVIASFGIELVKGLNSLFQPLFRKTKKGKIIKAPYPFGFEPTFHRYRLEEPQLKKQPQNIFVCSMSDLFGKWVPYEWLDKVLDVCKGAPQHRFLFLTKNPKRYMELYNVLPKRDNFFFGTTVTNENTDFWYSDSHNWFLSIEPIMSKFSGKGITGQVSLLDGPGIKPKWVIIGAETGSRKDKVIPKKEWIEVIVNECRKNGIPVFLKNSLAPIWGDPLIREYPWEKGGKNAVKNP